MNALLENKKTDKLPVGSKAWADQLRKETKNLAEHLDADYLRLARNLWDLFDRPIDNDPKNTSWLTKWGYGKIGEYAEQELGIHRRIAERLRRIWMVVGVDCKLDEAYLEKFISLGRSKARVLTRPGVMTPESAQHWIDRALQVNYITLEAETVAFLTGRAGVMPGTLGKVEPLDADGEVIEDDDELAEVPPVPPHAKSLFQNISSEVQAQVQEGLKSPLMSAKQAALLASQAEEDEKPAYKTFALFPDQADTVKAALERCAELSGSKKDGQNLSLMALDFLATNEFKKASLEQTQRFFKRMEKALEVKLIVLTATDHELLYGYKVLEQLLGSPGVLEAPVESEEMPLSNVIPLVGAAK